MKALDFAISNEVTGIRIRSLVENAEQAKAKGEDIKASMLVKRIADLRKVSTIYLVSSRSLKMEDFLLIHFYLGRRAKIKGELKLQALVG